MIGVIFWWINSSVAGAATLNVTRAGDHDDFTRIVFEFENFGQFMEPVISREGTLSVVFPNTTTILRSPIIYRATTRVEVIRLDKRDSYLAVEIALAIPHFKVKSYLLSDPDRYVLDIYWRPPSPIEQIPIPKTASLENNVEVERAEPGIKDIRGIVKGSAIQPIERASIFSSSYDFLQTFFLAGLNLFILVIIVLLSMILSRQIRVIDSAHLEYLPDPRREPDDSINTIDKKIKQRLKGVIDLEV